MDMEDKKMEGSQPLHEIPSAQAVKRAKVLWRFCLVFNFALAYIFALPGKKRREKNEVRTEVTPAPAAVTAPPQEEPVPSPPIHKPVIARQPVPEDQQRQIFEWMLDEKRKIVPQNQQWKQRINEEKAILKEFIRSKTFPRF